MSVSKKTSLMSWNEVAKALDLKPTRGKKMSLALFNIALLLQALPMSSEAAEDTQPKFTPRQTLCGALLSTLRSVAGYRTKQSRTVRPIMTTKLPIQNLQDIRSLLVVVAMPIEYEAIRSQLSTAQLHKVHQGLEVEVLETKIGQRRIFLGKSGVGTVNAALMTVLVDQMFHIDAIILLGVGGSLHPKLNVGDLVVSTKIIQHDAIFSGNQDDLMAPGELYLSLQPHERQSPQMVSADFLTQFLSEAAQENGHTVYRGAILSGNEFAAHVSRKKEIASLDQDALLVDMEAAGIAQVARKLNIPIAAAKTVADRYSPDAGIESDYKTFAILAAAHSGHIFSELLKKFEGNP